MTEELKPGDLAIIASASFFGRYYVARVVKVNPATWVVQRWDRPWNGKEYGWGKEERRNKGPFYRLPADADPAAIHAALKSAYGEFTGQRRAADVQYKNAVRRLAHGGGEYAL